MAFQSAVQLQQGFGVPGELYSDYPHRAQSYILQSVDAAYNVFGRAFTKQAEGIAEAGAGGALGIFAGILVHPKGSASRGTQAGGSLAPTTTLANEEQGELLTEGAIVVTLPGAAAIGDLVVYDDTTGVLETISPGAGLPVGKSFAYAEVDYFTVTGSGLAVITLTPTLTIPT